MVLRPASRPNFDGLGLRLRLGCPCLSLGLRGAGLDYNPVYDLMESKDTVQLITNFHVLQHDRAMGKGALEKILH